MDGKPSAAYNLGNGSGFSVQEVIDTVRTATGRDFLVVDRERRPGDPARLVADSRLAREKLGWSPLYSELRTIVEHAWGWEQKMAIHAIPSTARAE
jgi:UDP-glucose 4-epimerase